MSIALEPNMELIPGYVLSKRLGCGGYGEVWEAQAPGGLTKAIKFIHGRVDEKRASRELEAPMQVKGARHPFLLSLERIEAVHGHLVIVTELADESIKDRFSSYRTQNRDGIPRDELLGYLKDAADALDYMSEQHSLQHMDIKPENLLLLAGRVKVADFGLVQNLQKITYSIVGGLTPTYAAPELFEGRPSAYGDQYSLATLYQEMLSGHLPFHGTSPAELMRQHLHQTPDVSRLDQTDQQVVLRALNKDPYQRFTSCVEFVNSLTNRSYDPVEINTKPMTVEPDESRLSDSANPNHTVVLDTWDSEHQGSGNTLAINPGDQTASMIDPMDGLGLPRLEIEESALLPPIEAGDDEHGVIPTVFIGIGESASETLKHVRRQLFRRFGNLDDISTVKTLILDSDDANLARCVRGTDGTEFSPDDLVVLPLRRPQDYRSKSKELLSWLSRRWLYNIPRSLQTQGLRPLGRLSLVDQGFETLRRIRSVIMQVTDADAIRQASEATNTKFVSGRIRIYVVASISGGTGSGISLDLGYGVQSLLGKLGLPRDDVYGILMYSTGRAAGSREMASVNAYAWLTEFNHYASQTGGYPGAPDCDVPPFPGGHPSFRQTYLVHMGNQLDAYEWEEGTRNVAKCLYLDAFDSTGQLLDVCRRTDEGADHSKPSLRSFGLVTVNPNESPLFLKQGNLLQQMVLHHWLGNRTKTDGQPMSPSKLELVTAFPFQLNESQILLECQELTQRLKLNHDDLKQVVSRLIDSEFQGRKTNPLDNIVQRLPDSDLTGLTPGEAVQAVSSIDELLGISAFSEATTNEPRSVVIPSWLEDLAGKFIHSLGENLSSWLRDRLDDPRQRLPGANRSLDWFSEHLKDLHLRAIGERRGIDKQMKQLNRANSSQSQKDADLTGSRGLAAVNPMVTDYWSLGLRLLSLVGSLRIVTGLQSRLEGSARELSDFRHAVLRILEGLEESERMSHDAEHVDLAEDLLGVARPAVEYLEQHREDLCEELDRNLQSSLDKRQNTLHHLLTEQHDGCREVARELMFGSRSVMRSIATHNQMLPCLLKSAESVKEFVARMSKCLEMARPKLMECGGGQRLLLAAPDAASKVAFTKILTEEFGESVSAVDCPESGFVLCYEVQDLPVDAVALNLIEQRADYLGFAAQLHTRVDVDWLSLFNKTSSPMSMA